MPKINPNTLRKLNLSLSNPDLVKDVSPNELAEMVVVVLSQVKVIEQAIKDGRLDGTSPVEGKDFVGRSEATKMLTDAVNSAVAGFDSKMAKTGSQLEKQVQEALANIRNGDNGVVTEEEISRAARMALELIELPDFEEMVSTSITKLPFASRDALELIVDNDDKLEQSAVKDLKEDLAKLWDEVQKKSAGNGVGGTSKPAVYRFIKDAIADGTITSGGSLPDQTGNAGKFLNTDGTDATWESIPGGGDMLAANNLSDVASASTSRSNLGLGTAATEATSAFATAAQGSTADSAQQPPSEGAFADGDKTKLDAIEASADVTDAANVEAAGALMDSEVTNLAQVKAFDSTDYAAALGADDNYVTDAEKTVIGNTSNTNTGDEAAASVTVAGVIEVATAAETDTGTDATRALSPDGFQASKRNIRWLSFNLIDAATACTVAAFGGDFVSPIAGVIQQSDSSPFYLYATNSTAGTTGTMVVDISIGGTSIMTTNKLDFDTGEKTTTTAATKPDLTTTALAVGDIITFDVDSLHTTPASGLTVYMAVLET